MRKSKTETRREEGRKSSGKKTGGHRTAIRCSCLEPKSPFRITIWGVFFFSVKRKSVRTVSLILVLCFFLAFYTRGPLPKYLLRNLRNYLLLTTLEHYECFDLFYCSIFIIILNQSINQSSNQSALNPLRSAPLYSALIFMGEVCKRLIRLQPPSSH